MTNINPSVEEANVELISIEINDHKIDMPPGPTTGREIKQAAINQNVSIELEFVLQVDLPNGSSRIIGNEDKITSPEHRTFTAIAPDDNS